MPAFIRCYYGVEDKNNTSRLIQRHSKIRNDIKRIQESKFKIPFIVYCMGKDNYEYIKSQGFDCVKICDEEYKYNLTTNQYRNKMDCIKAAFNDFTEITYLDWDVYQQKELPSNYWEECRKRELIQGCFQNYRRLQCAWRKNNQRTVINGGFLYIGWKDVINQAIEIYDTKFNAQNNDEIAYTYLIEYINKGFDLNKLVDGYETPFCRLHKNFVVDKKDTVFLHVYGKSK